MIRIIEKYDFDHNDENAYIKGKLIEYSLVN